MYHWLTSLLCNFFTEPFSPPRPAMIPEQQPAAVAPMPQQVAQPADGQNVLSPPPPSATPLAISSKCHCINASFLASVTVILY